MQRMRPKPVSLDELDLMLAKLQVMRRSAVLARLAGTRASKYVRALKNALRSIDALPGGRFDKHMIAGTREVTVRLDYERTEIERDIAFLERPLSELIDLLAETHESIDSFRQEVDRTVAFLRSRELRTVVTDRDGTVNNYCGRYRSSHQAIYNARFLTNFAGGRPADRRASGSAPTQTVLLTAAPLEGDGLLSLSAMPDDVLHLAGSKGREYLSREGRRGSLTFSSRKQERLREFNSRLDRLLEQGENHVFALIGSGVQHKVGETAVGRQDIHGSIPDDESRVWLQTVRSLVRELDPDGTELSIEDTGRDIEVTLTTDSSQLFDKGAGLAYLDEELGLDLAGGGVLVCGDTAADLAMFEKAVEIAGRSGVAIVLVSEDTELIERARSLRTACHTVSSPDALIAAMQVYSQREAGV